MGAGGGGPNTIAAFDPRPDRVWRFVMHGPDGTDYRNRSAFDEGTAPGRVVFRHRKPTHRFRMEMTVTPAGAGAQLT